MSRYNPYRSNELIIKNKNIEIENLKSEIEAYKQGTLDFIKAIYEWGGILDTKQLHDRIINDVLFAGVMGTLYDKLYMPEDLYEMVYDFTNTINIKQ